MVTKDVDPYTVVGGSPAKEIRQRFDAETIDLLLKLKWWDWPVNDITDHFDLITKGDLNGLRKLFIEKHTA